MKRILFIIILMAFFLPEVKAQFLSTTTLWKDTVLICNDSVQRIPASYCKSIYLYSSDYDTTHIAVGDSIMASKGFFNIYSGIGWPFKVRNANEVYFKGKSGAKLGYYLEY